MSTSHWRQTLREMSLLHTSIIVFALSFLIYAFSPQGAPLVWDFPHGGEMVRIARTLAATGAYANPYSSAPTGLSAHAAPGYVFFYAAILKLLGGGFAGQETIWAFNLGFLALQLALLPALAEELGLGLSTGIVAAAFGAILQPYRILPEWESMVTGLLLVGLCLLTAKHFARPGRWLHSALLGMLWGVAILTNPVCVVLLFVWPHIAARENLPERPSAARRAMGVAFAGAALVCAPWFVRNYVQFHSFFFVRDNLGLELSVSNNPCAKPTLLENLISGCHGATHPNPNPVIAAEVRTKGEIEFNRERMHQALVWIEANPRAFARLTAERVRKWWFPTLQYQRYGYPMDALTIISIFGLWMMFRERRRAALLFVSTLLLYPLIHYLVQFEARYRYPIFWATLLPAAYVLVQAFKRIRSSRATSQIVSEERSELVSA